MSFLASRTRPLVWQWRPASGQSVRFLILIFKWVELLHNVSTYGPANYLWMHARQNQFVWWYLSGWGDTQHSLQHTLYFIFFINGAVCRTGELPLKQRLSEEEEWGSSCDRCWELSYKRMLRCFLCLASSMQNSRVKPAQLAGSETSCMHNTDTCQLIELLMWTRCQTSSFLTTWPEHELRWLLLTKAKTKEQKVRHQRNSTRSQNIFPPVIMWVCQELKHFHWT